MKYSSLFLIFILPLQNVYLDKIPSLGGGLNFLNIMFLLSLVHALRFHAPEGTDKIKNLVVMMFLGYLFSYLWGCARSGFEEHDLFVFKDAMLPYLLFLIVYRTCDSIESMRHVFFSTILPLPYMFKVFYTNLSWMGFSSYQDKLRSNNGTFMELGSNEIAAFYATYTFVILAIAFHESNKYIRWGLYAVAGMNIYSIIYAFSRGAYLSSLVAVTILFFLSGRLKQYVMIVAILFLLSIAGVKVLPTATFERFDSAFVSEEELDDSVQKRLILWDIAKDKFASNPLFGIGYLNFKKENPYGMDTHNFYLKTLAEGGLVGLTILFAFLVQSLRCSVELYRTATDPFLKAFATGFIPCMVAMIIGNYFGDRFIHYPLISYFFVYLGVVAKGLKLSNEHEGANITQTVISQPNY